MKKILMCVPNISEGIRSEVVESVAQAVRQTPGVKLIDYSSDADHNRSVFTFLGEPEAVLAGAQALAVSAIEQIDMAVHHGSHPRIGAVDVVPFVPIRGVEIQEAVDISRRFGKFLAGLGVPVFYYENSATRPEHESLPNIRKGEYEGLAEKLKDPVWQPDEGEAVFNPKSGATVVGARPPLIAFNVNLHSQDIEIANRIARAIRHISGGYRYVRAMGVALEDKGMVQVSINMINYVKTPLPRVLETVRFEAARYGVAVAGTEIVGTIPLGALEEIVRFYLQTHDFDLNQIIESALIE